jgi:phage terminase large subunit-like protein
VQGKIEIVWQGTSVPASIKALGAECHVTGDTVRAVLSEESQDLAVDALRRERLHMISLVPVRTTLEQYFVEKLKRSEKTAGSMA